MSNTEKVEILKRKTARNDWHVYKSVIAIFLTFQDFNYHFCFGCGNFKPKFPLGVKFTCLSTSCGLILLVTPVTGQIGAVHGR